MKKNFLTKAIFSTFLSVIGISSCVLSSCTEDIDQSNRYTFTGETITNYLENRPELYSNFCFILKKARIGKATSGNMLNTLSTFGSYTCFAPTNDAIDKYIEQQYNKYIETQGSEDFEDTGIHSPYLEELSDSMATEIAKNHIIEHAYLTTDLSEGAFPQSNMNSRFMTLAWEPDTITGNVIVVINNSSKVLLPDEEVENGVIQTIDAVLAPSSASVGDLVGLHESFKIFTDALKLTCLGDSVQRYILDPDYANTMGTQTMPQPNGSGQNFADLPYAETKFQKYTILVESDDVFEANGIRSIDDLITLANKWYGEENFPGDVNMNDYTARNNPLNRFISYHILNCQLQYTSGSGAGGFIMEDYKEASQGFNSEIHFNSNDDRTEYYETMLEKMIKVTRPLSSLENNSKLIINYAQNEGTQISNLDMQNHINVTINSQTEAKQRPGLENFQNNAQNGIIHVIDKILIYNEDEMKGNIMNERIRIDASALFPELINNEIRWSQRKTQKMGYYIPNDYIKNIEVHNEGTYLYYTWPHGSNGEDWAVYQGDEFIACGSSYDYSFRLPPVPEGTYEIRFGFSKSDLRGIAQFYFDGKITGIPVDMQNGVNDIWTDDTHFSEDDISNNDKGIRNQGWMRGPESINLNENTTMRASKKCFRRIVTTAKLSGKGIHRMRFKSVTVNNGQANGDECSFDYLELVPKSVITNPTKPEDRK